MTMWGGNVMERRQEAKTRIESSGLIVQQHLWVVLADPCWVLCCSVEFRGSQTYWSGKGGEPRQTEICRYHEARYHGCEELLWVRKRMVNKPIPTAANNEHQWESGRCFLHCPEHGASHCKKTRGGTSTEKLHHVYSKWLFLAQMGSFWDFVA